MTDKPTAEQIALAREIAEHLVHGLATENEVRCALAAIIEITERAAKLADQKRDSILELCRVSGVTDVRATADLTLGAFATALRAGDHLK